MGKPLVSVLVDTYNHEKFIEQAIVSVLEQGLQPADMEVIVVDDGSTDRTAEIMRKFEPRVRLIHKANGGQASAFNAGIAEANGEIVAFLDGDDWWARGKVEAVLRAFEKNAEIAAVGHGYFEVVNDTPTGEMLVPKESLFLDLSSVEAARIASLGRMLLGTSRLAVRRHVLRRIGTIPLELVYAADTPVLVLALALGGALILDQPLCYYRLHAPDPANTSDATREEASALDLHHRFVERRDYQFIKLLLKILPQGLEEAGVSPEVIAAFLAPDRIDLERFELRHNGGGRWATIKAEARAFRWSYKTATTGYRGFRAFVGALALILGPRRFYGLRNWYAKQESLHRFRAALGSAEPTAPLAVLQRRPVTAPNARQ
jgi:glycosyltransferase involved in cell wall biosynthesis